MNRLKTLNLKELTLSLLRFGIVGASAVIVYAIAAYFLTNLGNVNPTLASALAYLIAIPISFIGQKYYTFVSNGKVKTEASLFLILQLFCLGTSTGLTYFITVNLGHHSNWAILAVCVILPPISYLTMAFMIFTQTSRTTDR